MSFIHIKKYRFAYSIIAIIILISGFCFENIKTEPTYLCTPIEVHNPTINITNNASSDTSIFTAEMLGFYSPAYHQRIESRQFLRNVKEEVISDFMYTFLLSINGTRFKFKYELVPFIKTSNKELVISYIHNTDGKKRI